MKKTMSLLLVAGLGLFTIGCSGDPGVSVETDVPDEEQMEMDDMGGDITAGLDEEGGDPGAEAPPE